MLVPLRMNLRAKASNWQGKRYAETPIRTKAHDDEERRRLGILPPLEESAAREAVAEAVKAQDAIASGKLNPGAQILAIMEARNEFGEIYRRAYSEALAEELIAAEWDRRMQKHRAQMAAIILLLG